MIPSGSQYGPIVVAMTGASGAIYGKRLVDYLLATDHSVMLVVSSAGKLVLRDEIPELLEDRRWKQGDGVKLRVFGEKDFGAPFCSGTFPFRAMVVVPASMGTVGAIASGISANCIHRGADVALKEGRRLVVVPREAPLSTIHLRNLLRLSQAGATVLPPSPAFYHRPRSLDDMIDFVVSRILDAIGIENDLIRRWGIEAPKSTQ